MRILWPVLTSALWATSGVAISLRGSLRKLNHPDCGITPSFATAESAISLFVTNGQEAVEGQFPWIVSLRYRRKGKPYSRGVHKCGGTLIGERMVVTAAHCIEVNNYELTTVVMGQIDISEVKEDRNEVAVESIIIHEDYKTDNGAAINDIAVLILKTRVRFNTDVRPACVYHRDTNQLDNPGRDGFEIAGWGKTETGRITDYLQWLPFTRIPANICQREMRKNRPDFVVLESQLCAEGDKELRADTCNGDSGGPMVTNVDQKWYLAGIVSFGTKNCDSSTPSFYTRVASFYEWLEKKMMTADQPKEGTWSSWGSFGPCSKTCGEGFRTRQRTCDGEMCKGDNFEGGACIEETCGGSGCDDDQFECRSGQCIQDDFKCDDIEDCDDKSDEHRCPTPPPRRTTTTTSRPAPRPTRPNTNRTPNRPIAPATGDDCTYSCTSIGGCQAKYVGAPRPGPSSGSCFPQSFGGKCVGTPPECSDCNTVEQCEKKK